MNAAKIPSEIAVTKPITFLVLVSYATMKAKLFFRILRNLKTEGG